MSNQPSSAITPYKRFVDIVKSDNVQQRFKDLLNQRGPAFLASLISVVNGSDKLQECDPGTILTSAAKAAILNLPIEPALGFAYIVPFKKIATFVLGYKGMVQLAIRTGQYVTINAAELYEGEQVVVDRLTGMVKLNGHRTGDEVVSYIAYFKLKNGFEKYLHMDKGSVERHANKYSKSYQYGLQSGRKDSAWFTNFDDMGKKTVLRLLLGKWGLMSIDMLDNDETELPVIGMADDPRFAAPQLTVPGFGDILEGSATDPTPDPEAPPSTDDLLQAVVAAGKFENIHEARNAFKKCKVEWNTFDKATAWASAYRQWRDLDAKPEKAAEYANSGELPH